MFQWIYKMFHAKSAAGEKPKTDSMNWDDLLQWEDKRTIDSFKIGERKTCNYLSHEGKYFYFCPHRSRESRYTKLPTPEAQEIYDRQVTIPELFCFCTEDFRHCPHYIVARSKETKVDKCR